MISVDDDSVRGGGKRIDRFRGDNNQQRKIIANAFECSTGLGFKEGHGYGGSKVVQDRFAVEKEWAAYAEVYRELLS